MRTAKRQTQFPRDIQAWVYTPVVDDTLRVKAEVAGTPLSIQLHLSRRRRIPAYAMNDDGLMATAGRRRPV